MPNNCTDYNPLFFYNQQNQPLHSLNVAYYSIFMLLFVVLFFDILVLQKIEKSSYTLTNKEFQDKWNVPRWFVTVLQYVLIVVCIVLGVMFFLLMSKKVLLRIDDRERKTTVSFLWFGIGFSLYICLFVLFIFACVLTSRTKESNEVLMPITAIIGTFGFFIGFIWVYKKTKNMFTR